MQPSVTVQPASQQGELSLPALPSLTSGFLKRAASWVSLSLSLLAMADPQKVGAQERRSPVALTPAAGRSPERPDAVNTKDDLARLLMKHARQPNIAALVADRSLDAAPAIYRALCNGVAKDHTLVKGTTSEQKADLAACVGRNLYALSIRASDETVTKEIERIAFLQDRYGDDAVVGGKDVTWLCGSQTFESLLSTPKLSGSPYNQQEVGALAAARKENKLFGSPFLQERFEKCSNSLTFLRPDATRQSGVEQKQKFFKTVLSKSAGAVFELSGHTEDGMFLIHGGSDLRQRVGITPIELGDLLIKRHSLLPGKPVERPVDKLIFDSCDKRFIAPLIAHLEGAAAYVPLVILCGSEKEQIAVHNSDARGVNSLNFLLLRDVEGKSGEYRTVKHLIKDLHTLKSFIEANPRLYVPVAPKDAVAPRQGQNRKGTTFLQISRGEQQLASDRSAA